MRRRLEREEKRQRAKRRIEIGALVVGVAFVASVGVGYATGIAKRRSAPATVVAAAPAPAAVATPAPEAEVATVARAANETQPPTPPPVSKPAPKPKPKPAPRPAQKPKPKSSTPTSPQRFRIGIGTVGYDPDTIHASASRPIVLTVGKGQGCAAGFNMPELDIHKDNSKGDVTFSLGTVKPGTYHYTCSMGMVSGTLIVR
jgi:outer membrane biosynthesis protein TonB